MIGGGCVLIFLAIAFCATAFYRIAVLGFSTPLNNYKLDQSTEWGRYDNPKLDFTIDYPKPWLTDNLPYGFHGDQTAVALINPFVTIRVVRDSSPISLEQVIASSHQYAQKRATEIHRQITFETLSTTPITVDALLALRAEYKSHNTGTTTFDQIFGTPKEHRMEVAFRRNDKAYIVEFEVNESDYPKLESVFQRMIQSIKFRQ